MNHYYVKGEKRDTENWKSGNAFVEGSGGYSILWQAVVRKIRAWVFGEKVFKVLRNLGDI